MEEFPSNAHHPKIVKAPVEQKINQPEQPEQPRTTRVVEGNVIRKKKSLGARAKEMLFGGESRGVFGYVFENVLIPAAKDMIHDAAMQGLEQQLWGRSRPGGGSYRGGGSGQPVAYHNMSRPGARRDERSVTKRARAMHNFDEIVLSTRREADEVIAQMFDVLSRFQQVTVADLYDMVNVTPDYTDRKYGWTDLGSADIRRVSEGYLLVLPRPEALD